MGHIALVCILHMVYLRQTIYVKCTYMIWVLILLHYTKLQSPATKYNSLQSTRILYEIAVNLQRLETSMLNNQKLKHYVVDWYSQHILSVFMIIYRLYTIQLKFVKLFTYTLIAIWL